MYVSYKRKRKRDFGKSTKLSLWSKVYPKNLRSDRLKFDECHKYDPVWFYEKPEFFRKFGKTVFKNLFLKHMLSYFRYFVCDKNFRWIGCTFLKNQKWSEPRRRYDFHVIALIKLWTCSIFLNITSVREQLLF